MLMRGFNLLLVAGLLCGAPVNADDKPKSADELIAKYVEAIGGQAALRSIKSIRLHGKTMMMGGIEAPITLELVRPNKIRTEIDFPGMKLVTAFDGATGWVISPFGGKTEPEKMSETQLTTVLDQADFDGPLVDYKKKGHAVEFLGEDEVEGTPTYKLKLTKKSGTVEYYHLDMEHYILVARMAKQEFQGGEIETVEHFGDYKLVGGRLFAHAVESKRGAMGGGALTFQKIEVNPTLSDDRFVMPEPEPEAKQAEPSKPKDKAEDKD